MTSYLFQPFACNCAARGDKLHEPVQADSNSPGFCRRCGLQMATGAAAGSLTGFLFQDTRCKCPPESQGDKLLAADKQWSAANIDLAPGTIIGGTYRIIELIGRGGMGEVYLAEHTALGKECALKVIPPDQVTDNSWQRFQNEAKAIAGLDQVNLVKVTDLGIHEGTLPYYAMEFIDGVSMAEMLRTHGPMSLQVVVDIFIQLCDGLDYAHRKGLIHHDLQ